MQCLNTKWTLSGSKPLGGAKLPWYGYAAGGALVAAIVGLLAKLAANVKATLDEYEKRMS